MPHLGPLAYGRDISYARCLAKAPMSQPDELAG
jgi:hypothetical protein